MASIISRGLRALGGGGRQSLAVVSRGATLYCTQLVPLTLASVEYLSH